MNLAQLHHILHPKLGPYSGTGEAYQYSMSADLKLLLEKSGACWQLWYVERGHRSRHRSFTSESEACEELLKLAKHA